MIECLFLACSLSAGRSPAQALSRTSTALPRKLHECGYLPACVYSRVGSYYLSLSALLPVLARGSSCCCQSARGSEALRQRLKSQQAEHPNCVSEKSLPRRAQRAAVSLSEREEPWQRRAG